MNLRASGPSDKWTLGQLDPDPFVLLSTGYPIIDIILFWKPDDAPEPVQTKKSVIIRNIRQTSDAFPKIHESVPKLKHTDLCMLNLSHQNQVGVLSCPACTLFGYNVQDDISMECRRFTGQEINWELFWLTLWPWTLLNLKWLTIR